MTSVAPPAPPSPGDNGNGTQTIPATLPFPKHGVRLSYFQEMIDKICGGVENIRGLTTTDVCNKFVMPYTLATKSSLCDLLASQDHPAVQPAQVFISHAWKFTFLDVVDALQHHFDSQEDIIVWFDLFSNNQHIGPTLTFDWWCGTFKTAIHDMQHVVMVLAPWQDPIPLTRAWCLFELYCAAETGCKFEIAMSSDEEKNFLASVIDDAEEIVHKMMGDVKVERSESFKPEDRAMIFKVVEDTVGFPTINAMVFDELRGWVVGTMEKHVYHLYQRAWNTRNGHEGEPCRALRDVIDDPDASWVDEDMYDSLLALATLYRLHSEWAACEKYYRLCYEWYKVHHGENQRQTLIRLNSLALATSQLGDISAAMLLYEDCLQRQQANGSEDDIKDSLATMSSLATCYQSLGKYEQARDMLQTCIQRQVDVFGTKSHHHVYATTQNLATVLDICGEYDESEKLYLELLDTLTTEKGADHPDTLRIMSNLSTLYQNPKVRRFEEAEKLLRQCIERRSMVLGPDHLDTLHARAALSVLLENTNRLEEAIPVLQDVYERRRRICGPEHPLTLQTMHNLALQTRSRGYLATGDEQLTLLEAAKSLFLDYIQARSTLVGNQHPDVILAKYNLATLYDRQNQLEDALALYRAVLEGREGNLGVNHPDTHVAHHSVAFTLQRLSRYEESIEEHRENLSRRYTRFGPVYTGTWSTVYFLALAIDAQYPSTPPGTTATSVDEAVRDQRRSVINQLTQLFRSQLLESIPFTSSPDEEPRITDMKRTMLQQLFDGYVNLFSRFSSAYCERIALVLLRVLVEMQVRMHANDETHEDVLAYQYALAKLLWRPVAHTEYTDPFTGEIVQNVVEDDDEAETRMDGCREAEALFQSVWTRREKILGEDHAHVIAVLCDYAQSILRLHQNWSKARELYEDALRRSVRVHGYDNETSADIADVLWDIYQELGVLSEAPEELYQHFWERIEGAWIRPWSRNNENSKSV